MNDSQDLFISDTESNYGSGGNPDILSPSFLSDSLKPTPEAGVPRVDFESSPLQIVNFPCSTETHVLFNNEHLSITVEPSLDSLSFPKLQLHAAYKLSNIPKVTFSLPLDPQSSEYGNSIYDIPVYTLRWKDAVHSSSSVKYQSILLPLSLYKSLYGCSQEEHVVLLWHNSLLQLCSDPSKCPPREVLRLPPHSQLLSMGLMLCVNAPVWLLVTCTRQGHLACLWTNSADGSASQRCFESTFYILCESWQEHGVQEVLWEGTRAVILTWAGSVLLVQWLYHQPSSRLHLKVVSWPSLRGSRLSRPSPGIVLLHDMCGNTVLLEQAKMKSLFEEHATTTPSSPPDLHEVRQLLDETGQIEEQLQSSRKENMWLECVLQQLDTASRLSGSTLTHAAVQMCDGNAPSQETRQSAYFELKWHCARSSTSNTSLYLDLVHRADSPLLLDPSPGTWLWSVSLRQKLVSHTENESEVDRDRDWHFTKPVVACRPGEEEHVEIEDVEDILLVQLQHQLTHLSSLQDRESVLTTMLGCVQITVQLVLCPSNLTPVSHPVPSLPPLHCLKQHICISLSNLLHQSKNSDTLTSRVSTNVGTNASVGGGGAICLSKFVSNRVLFSRPRLWVSVEGLLNELHHPGTLMATRIVSRKQFARFKNQVPQFRVLTEKESHRFQFLTTGEVSVTVNPLRRSDLDDASGGKAPMKRTFSERGVEQVGAEPNVAGPVQLTLHSNSLLLLVYLLHLLDVSPSQRLANFENFNSNRMKQDVSSLKCARASLMRFLEACDKGDAVSVDRLLRLYCSIRNLNCLQ